MAKKTKETTEDKKKKVRKEKREARKLKKQQELEASGGSVEKKVRTKRSKKKNDIVLSPAERLHADAAFCEALAERLHTLANGLSALQS